MQTTIDNSFIASGKREPQRATTASGLFWIVEKKFQINLKFVIVQAKADDCGAEQE